MRSGRFQLVLRDPITKKQFGMGSYARKEDAERAGIEHVAQQNKGLWVDPRNGEIPLGEYMTAWLDRQAANGRHSESYQELSRLLFEKSIKPYIGTVLLTDLRPSTVSTWYDRLVADRQPKPGIIPAKAYRLLHACLNEAVSAELILRNPAMKREAGVERSKERPLLEAQEVAAIANAIQPWWRTLILVSTYCALRFGECERLRVEDIDFEKGTLRIEKAKTHAGIRTVHIPGPLLPLLTEQVAGKKPGELVFVGPKGGPLQRHNMSRDFRAACSKVGLSGVHFHDLRHAGGTMAAQEGATERELMSRLGHSSANAARRYQHAAQRRDQELADKLSGRIVL